MRTCSQHNIHLRLPLSASTSTAHCSIMESEVPISLLLYKLCRVKVIYRRFIHQTLTVTRNPWSHRVWQLRLPPELFQTAKLSGRMKKKELTGKCPLTTASRAPDVTRRKILGDWKMWFTCQGNTIISVTRPPTKIKQERERRERNREKRGLAQWF